MPFGYEGKGPSEELFPLRLSALLITLKGYLLILNFRYSRETSFFVTEQKSEAIKPLIVPSL